MDAGLSVQETGKVFHFHLGLQARRLEALAKAEAAAGHGETALDFYFQATVQYEANSAGPNSATATLKRKWYES